ncbi:mercury(II) reductase [Candidatus Woesearchaeota archaeon]|nr:mercury(II) reductase [Candidatus Woesearchaeota archaeon]
MFKEYDLIIIGGGAGAFAAANMANKLKKKTLLINYEKILPLGGTCVNVGCVPSKIMLHQGEEYYYALRSQFRAVRLQGKSDFIEALKETHEMVKRFRSKNYEKVIENQEYVDFKEGLASFEDSHTVKVGNERFKGKHFLIATGASNFVPPIKGIDKIDFITNVNIFNLKKKPKSVIIIGGGPLGMEFSQIFHHFGVKVTVLQRSERIIPKFDSMLGEELQKHLEEEGIAIYKKANTKEVKKTKNGIELIVEVDGKKKIIYAEKLMLATGLKPHTELLETEKAGVELDDKGFIKVDEHMQSSQKHIYAAGDVTGLMPLETTAAKEGNFAVLNMFENVNKKINYNEVPHAVFTSPEVAAVGITEEEFMKKYNVCLCRTVTLDHVEKAAAIKDTRGLIRMVLDPKTKIVIGVHIIGPMAADIITTATYAIKNKMTIYDIRDTVHIFPTLSEMIKKVAQSFDQNLDEMACCVE